MAHTPNRRVLTDAEITELDDIASEYDAARERAREIFLAAQAAYRAMIGGAADRRDDRILDIIDAAGPEGRGTQSRVGEHLGMTMSYLAVRLRKARLRARTTKAPSPNGG